MVEKWALCLLCQAPAMHQAITTPKFTGGRRHLKKKNISQLNSRKALNQKQMTLFSQIQCEPCLKAAAPAIPALQTQPGIWPQFVALSVTCCVILDKLLLFSMTSLSQRSIGRENTPDIKDSQMTNYSNEKTQIRLTQTEKTFAYSVKPFRKKKDYFCSARKATNPQKNQGAKQQLKGCGCFVEPCCSFEGHQESSCSIPAVRLTALPRTESSSVILYRISEKAKCTDRAGTETKSSGFPL